jgi:hypothetical protein
VAHVLLRYRLAWTSVHDRFNGPDYSPVIDAGAADRALRPSPRATVGLLVGVDVLTIHGSHRLTLFGEVQVVFPYVEPYLHEQASAAIGIAIRRR